MRCLVGPDCQDDKIYDKEHVDQCYDAKFARMRMKIRATGEQTRRFNRISSGQKFRMKSNEGSDANSTHGNDAVDTVGITYLDSVIQHLEDNNVKQEAITELVKYLKEHQFDTESLDNDIGDGSMDGNIPHLLQSNEQCLNCIISFLGETKGRFYSD